MNAQVLLNFGNPINKHRWVNQVHRSSIMDIGATNRMAISYRSGSGEIETLKPKDEHRNTSQNENIETSAPNPSTAQVAQIFKRVSRSDGKQMKRYNLVLPQELFDYVQEVADKKGVNTVEILRKFIKLGLLVSWIEELPDASLIVREGDTERELLVL